MEIVKVQTRSQWRDFHRVPFRVYRDDPYWVPQLYLERKFHFSPSHNPYFEHAKAEFFLAYENNEPVGRITAQIDDLHLARYNDATGHFGFIEAINDPALFAQLLATAEDWLRGQGMKRAVGPVSFSMWDQPGLLVEGFDSPPYVLMGHARPYFAPHIEAAGYRQAEDLLAYRYKIDIPAPVELRRIMQRAMQRGELRVRTLHQKEDLFLRDVELLRDIINDAWSNNWGFVDMTKAEIDDIAGLLKHLLRPGDVAIAEYRGEPAAFAAIFPNVNEAIRDLNGRLLPFGWAKLLWRLKVRHPRTARMAMMGVRKAHQNSFIGAALALSVIESASVFNRDHGVVEGEFSWVLERNERVRQVIEWGGAIPYKRYRIYQKAL